MPKPITREMIEVMSSSERKNLHGNATVRDTPAAKAILELIAQSELNMAKVLAAKANDPGPKSRSKAKKMTVGALRQQAPAR